MDRIKIYDKLIDDCKSGEIKFVIYDELNDYKNFFQFVDTDIENQYGDSFADWPNQDPPWGNEVPDGFLNDRKVYYSSFTYERSIEVFDAKSILKECWPPNPLEDTDLYEWIFGNYEGPQDMFSKCVNRCSYVSYDEQTARKNDYEVFNPDNTIHLLENVIDGENIQNVVKDSIIVAHDYSDVGMNGYQKFYLIYKNGDIKELELY